LVGEGRGEGKMKKITRLPKVYYNLRIPIGKNIFGFTKYKDFYIEVKVIARRYIEFSNSNDVVKYLIEVPKDRLIEVYKSELFFEAEWPGDYDI